MRAPKAASVAIALSLSGPLAFGSAGDAFAAASALSADAGPSSTVTVLSPPALAAPGDTETTQAQFRVIERLGQLAELTGSLGRLARDKDAGPLLLGTLRERLHRQVRLVTQAVRQARPDRTLPAPDSGGKQSPLPSERTVTLSVAAKGFLTAVDGVIHVDRTNPLARTATSKALVRHLAAVETAAMREAGMAPRMQALIGAQAEALIGARAGKQAGGERRRAARGAVTGTRAAGGPAGSRTKSGTDGRNGTDGLGSGLHSGTFVVAGSDGHRLAQARRITGAVGALVRDVLRAPNGRLSRERLAAHNSRIADAFPPYKAETLPAPADEQPKTLPAPVDAQGRDLPRAAAPGRGANPLTVRQSRAGAVMDLHTRTLALLRSAAKGGPARTGSAAGAVTRSAADYLLVVTGDGRS